MKPTNPAAQKAALTGSSQYKVSPRPASKIKPRPLHSIANGKVNYKVPSSALSYVDVVPTSNITPDKVSYLGFEGVLDSL